MARTQDQKTLRELRVREFWIGIGAVVTVLIILAMGLSYITSAPSIKQVAALRPIATKPATIYHLKLFDASCHQVIDTLRHHGYMIELHGRFSNTPACESGHAGERRLLTIQNRAPSIVIGYDKTGQTAFVRYRFRVSDSPRFRRLRKALFRHYGRPAYSSGGLKGLMNAIDAWRTQGGIQIVATADPSPPAIEFRNVRAYPVFRSQMKAAARHSLKPAATASSGKHPKHNLFGI